MRFARITLLFSWFLVVGLPIQHAAANPNTKNPRALILIHNSGGIAAVHQQAAKHYAESLAIVERLVQLSKQNRLETASPQDFVRGYTQLGYLSHRAKQLEFYGETAGFNLGQRHFQLSETYTQLFRLYQQTSKYQGVKRKAEASIAKFDKVLEREKGIVESHMKAGKLDAAWEALLKAQFETMAEPITYLGQAPPRYFLMGAFSTEKDINALWKKKGNELLAARRDKLTPDYDALLKQLSAAASSVGSKGTADIGGQAITGPAVVTQCHILWRKAHVATLQACYVELARIPSNAGTEANYQKMIAAYGDFCSKYAERIAAIVTADATRVPTAEAQPLYQQYVAVLGVLTLELDNEVLREPLEKALNNFLFKSPELGRSVNAYRDATAEQLRWLKRVAKAEAAKAAEATQPLLTQLAKASTSNATLPALFNPRYAETAELRTEATMMLQTIAPPVMNKTASIGSGAKATPTAKSMIGRYDNRVYCVLTDASEWLAPEAAQLRDSLFVDAQHPPLTLEAAGALASFDHGHFIAAGGVVTAIRIESMTTRLATLPEAAHPFVRLGPFEAEKRSEMHAVKQLVVGCDLQTKWLATPYAFVQAP